MKTDAVAPLRRVADLAGRRALVLGLARSGVAAARFLADAGAAVIAYDRRPAPELADVIAALEGRSVRLALGVGEAEARALLAGADLVVTSPSISAHFPTTDPWLREALLDAEARGAAIVSEVDLFLRLSRARILAVTGTKGKTTTTALLGAMLAAADIPHAVGGNIGTPLIERANELGPGDWAVLELSELQLPTISRGAEIAVYTNIAADHLDRHGSVEAYRAMKARLAELTATSGVVVLNVDDPGCVELGERLAGDVRWYGLDGSSRQVSLQATVVEGTIHLDGSALMPVAEVPLPGRHMLSNVLAAALGARVADAPHDAIAAGIRAFGGVPHRLELLGERNGVRWVNDSQATIPMAAIAALDAYDAPVVLIAGGQGKGLDLGGFVERIVERCRTAVLIGETAVELERLIAGRVSLIRAGSMDLAVDAAAAAARPGDVVLLAPAAASFDMFADYAARGDAFRAAAARIGVRPEGAA
ncbi:MAG: UDP-N-acetylmuramoyl-L-alanine--D-glutamate ligase [Candidatus Limnocylindria bacterium]